MNSGHALLSYRLATKRMDDPTTHDLEEKLSALKEQALRHTRASVQHMEKYDIRPEGNVQLFLPPEERARDEINRLPYEHDTKQTVVYETEPGEFSALCPFSGLPDFGTLRVEYVPGNWLIELKSLKHYIISWRNIGAAQEEITALIYKDLIDHLDNPDYLRITTAYNVRGGINATCTVDSREQG